MSRQLKIGGDTSELRKSIIDISRMINKDLGKSKIELFSPETKKLLRGEAASQVENIKSKSMLFENLQENILKHCKKWSKVLKKNFELKRKFLKLKQHIAKLNTDQSKISEFGTRLVAKMLVSLAD
jgi:hypothetical protein